MSDAVSPGAGDDDEDDDEVSFDPQAIRRRLPGGLTDKQDRAMICAVRNPDAGFSAIAEACGVSDMVVRGGLEHLARGIIGERGGNGAWIRERGGRRYADNFEELTDRQKAVVDYLARHPSFDWRKQTSNALNRAIRAHHKGAPEMSDTYPKKVAQNYTDLIEAYRERLLALGEELDADDDFEVADAFNPDTPREYLEAAGITQLPTENLDSLDAFGDTEAVPDEERLERAFKNASERAGKNTSDVSPDVKPGNFENHLHESRETFGDDDVEPGTGYEGVVNNVVNWGIWVTIGGDPDDPNDVSGVVPVEKLAGAGHELSDYNAGDALRVVATGVSNTDDGKVRHRFDIPTVDRLPVREDAETDAQDDAEESEGETPEIPEPTRTGTQDAERTDTVEVPAETLESLIERVRTAERDLERVEAQAEENAEALPDDDTARQLNEAAETVLEAEGQFDALTERMNAVENRVEYLEALESDVDHMAERLPDALDRLDSLEAATHDAAGESDTTIVEAIEALENAGIAYEITATNETES